MEFSLNATDPVIKELLAFADNDKQLLEEALLFAYDDTTREKDKPVPVDLIVQHIAILKDFRKRKYATRG